MPRPIIFTITSPSLFTTRASPLTPHTLLHILYFISTIIALYPLFLQPHTTHALLLLFFPNQFPPLSSFTAFQCTLLQTLTNTTTPTLTIIILSCHLATFFGILLFLITIFHDFTLNSALCLLLILFRYNVRTIATLTSYRLRF